MERRPTDSVSTDASAHHLCQTAAEPEKRQAEIKYLQALRDHAGPWGYADYAFYPLDEPGLTGKRSGFD